VRPSQTCSYDRIPPPTVQMKFRNAAKMGKEMFLDMKWYGKVPTQRVQGTRVAVYITCNVAVIYATVQ
jgi:hypothetical protein